MSIKFACQIKVLITHVYSYPFFNFLLQAFTSLRALTTTTQTSVHRVDFQQKKRVFLKSLIPYVRLMRKKGQQSGKGCQEILAILVYQFYTGFIPFMVSSMMKVLYMMKCIPSHLMLWRMLFRIWGLIAQTV